MQKFFKSVLNLIFPPVCLSCKKVLRNDKILLCDRCMSGMHSIGEFVCSSCGKRVVAEKPLCHGGSIPVFALFSYEDEVTRAIIHTFKYEGVQSAVKTIFSISNKQISSSIFFRFDKELKISIIPIPLSKERERKRGFNQSELIACELMKVFGENGMSAEVKRRVIKRVDTKISQTECKNHIERKENVENCFEVLDILALENSLIVLVDDVVTSGATIEEVARILRKEGIRNITGFAVAKT